MITQSWKLGWSHDSCCVILIACPWRHSETVLASRRTIWWQSWITLKKRAIVCHSLKDSRKQCLLHVSYDDTVLEFYETDNDSCCVIAWRHSETLLASRRTMWLHSRLTLWNWPRLLLCHSLKDILKQCLLHVELYDYTVLEFYETDHNSCCVIAWKHSETVLASRRTIWWHSPGSVGKTTTAVVS